MHCVLVKYTEKKALKDQFQFPGKLPTYPSPKSTLTLTSDLGENGGLGEG